MSAASGMRGIAILVCLLTGGSAAVALEGAAPAPGSAALVEDAQAWDGRAVSFTGEAISEVMRRGAMAWIHLNDDAYGLSDTGAALKLAGFNSGIGVWIDAELASRIAFFGDYDHHGDVVEVTGAFHAACRQHGGDTDIHADTLRIVRPGGEVPRPVSGPRLAAGGVLVGTTGLLFLLRALARRRRQP